MLGFIGEALIVVAAFLFAVQPTVSYLRDSKNLRRFPARSYAGLSSLWPIHKKWQYKHYLAIHEAHKQLETHVRTAPNHVSISDPQALQDIYGYGAGMLRDTWYNGGAGGSRHMADARVKAEHQAKRKPLAHEFARKTIANLETIISDTVSTLITQIEHASESESTMNMRRYFNFFTIDIFSRLLFGKSLGCIERGDDMVDAQTGGGQRSTKSRSSSLCTMPRISTPSLGTDLDNDSDIFAKLLLNNRREPVGLLLGEILAESSVMTNAGTDTTTAALTNTVFLLYKHPAVLTKLRKQLDEATGNTVIPSYGASSELLYLRACVEESLRLRPASSVGLPRVIPRGGRVVAAEIVDEGVTVSVPTYTLLRDPDAFERPDSYDPERWISGGKEKLSKAHFPFSVGPTACIGRNIAYFEQLLVIAALVKEI